MKSYDTTLTRLILILTKLSNNERPTLRELCEEFNVGLRTIQRDIYERLAYFPIEKTRENQIKFIDGFSLNKCMLQNDEMLLVYLAMSGVKTISKNFESKIDHIFAKLLNPGFFSPYFIKPQMHQDLDFNSPIVKDIEKSISNKNIAKVSMQNKTIIIKPYKIVNFDGIWYLLARDINEEKVKTFIISHIKQYTKTSENYELEQDIDIILDNVHSAWFEDGDTFEVKVHISKNISHFFILKKFYPTQTIYHTYDDGSIDVSFEISTLEDVDNLIKSWFPDIIVIEPQFYRDKIHHEINRYFEQYEEKR